MNREQRISEMDEQTDRKLLPTHAGQFLGDASQPARSFPQMDRFDAPPPLRARTDLPLPPAGQNSSRAGLGAGAVMSIILALLLLAVLLVVCGPLAYKKVVKKCR